MARHCKRFARNWLVTARGSAQNCPHFIVRLIQVLDERKQQFALLFGHVNEAQAEADWPHVMRDFAGQFERLAVWYLGVERQHLADVSLARGVDEAPALREIGDAGRAIAMAVPNGIETNFQTLFAAAIVHVQFPGAENNVRRTEVRTLLG